MSDPTIKGVCVEARRYNFQLFNHRQPIPIYSSDEYMDQCQKIFEDAKIYQRRAYRIEPKLPTAAHIRQIGEFAKKHKLNVNISGYASGGVLALTGTMIGVQPRAAFIGRLSWILDHEFGHLRDDRLIAAYAPELKSALESGRWCIPKMKKYILYILTVMKFMRDGLSQSDRFEFDRLQKEVLGDLGRYDERAVVSLMLCLGELFRGGEEILDKRFKSIIMDWSFTSLKKHGPDEHYHRIRSITNHKGERIDLWRLFPVARLQEANLWERFIRLPDYKSDSLRYIRPNHLKFFRLCIRGASGHFAKTSKP